MSLILVGAGGHAKILHEILSAQGIVFSSYVDPVPAAWLEEVQPDLRRFHGEDDPDLPSCAAFVLGLGGTTSAALRRRLDIAHLLLGRFWSAGPVCHARATVSSLATVASGSCILAHAIVQPGARIGIAAIVNSAAVVEHDTTIGNGAHIAPGAIVLGGAFVGECAMIGAGAVVLPGARVEAGTLVPALSRFPAREASS